MTEPVEVGALAIDVTGPEELRRTDSRRGHDVVLRTLYVAG